jgi:hypothetical protein
MLEKRRSTRARAVLCSLAAPLLLAHCGSTSSGGEGRAGTAGAAAESGAAGALGGAIDQGGAASGGKGGAASGGAAGDSGEAGLGGQSSAAASGADAGAGGDSSSMAGGGACAEQLLAFPSPSAQHVAVCSTITYPMNPPVYGDHYPVWAAYKSYSFPVPLGFLVHNLEHGAVVLLYNCPQGCADEVASAQAFLDALPLDPRCTAEVKHQTILSPDPTLPARWAAVAWGHSLTADCFDSHTFRSFYDAKVGHGPEDICGDGADLASDTCL